MSYSETISGYRHTLEQRVQHLYGPKQIVAILAAFDLAAQLHREEFRDSGSPFLVHPNNVALSVVDILSEEETIADLPVVVDALLHDTVESFLSRFKSSGDWESLRDDYIKSIMKIYIDMGNQIVSQISGDVEKVLRSLTLLPSDVYFEMGKRILDLDETNVTRALMVKLQDRRDNVVDTLGFPPERKLKSVYKSAYFANETKAYMIRGSNPITQLNRCLRNAVYHIKTPRRCLASVKGHNRLTRLFFEKLGKSMEYLVVDTGTVVQEVISIAQMKTYELEDSSMGQEIRRRFFWTEVDLKDYESGGGLDRMTRSVGSTFDGMLMFYARSLAGYEQVPENIERLYRDSKAFEAVLRKLVMVRDYYVHGFECDRLLKEVSSHSPTLGTC